MSKGPRMQKHILQFSEDCLQVNLKMKNGLSVDKCVDSVMGTLKVYLLLTLRKPLVQDKNLEKHLSSGLGEKGLFKRGHPTSLLRHLKIEYLHFTDLGLGYKKIYDEEVKGNNLSWLDFSVKVLTESGYYYRLVEQVEQYTGHLSGVIKGTPAPLKPKCSEAFKVFDGSAAELREKANSLFNDLYGLCDSMDKKSHSLIKAASVMNSIQQGEFYDFMLQNHSRYFAGAKSNETELKKLIDKAQQGFEDALVILCLIESLQR